MIVFGILASVLGSLPAALPCRAVAQMLEPPPALPPSPPSADVTGNWDFVPVPLPDRNVTHLLVSRGKDRIWIGTRSGVVSYDGVAARAPHFESADAQQAIHVNSLVEARDGSLIVGTINDSLWLWKADQIVALHGSCPRSMATCPRAEWALARADDGAIFVASSAFAPRQAEALAALRAAVADRIVPVAVQASFLGFAGDELVAVSNYGAISIIDRTSGAATRLTDLALPSGTFVRNVSYDRDGLLIGTDAHCLGVALTAGSKPTILAEGNCTAIYRQADGTTWLSTSTLYRHDGDGWAGWSPGQSGAITASAVAEDGMANVWVGAPGGLWRYFDLARDHVFAGGKVPISSIASAPEGGAIVGLSNGEVWRLDATAWATRVDLPPPAQQPASAYFHGVIVSTDPAGTSWALTGAGLFRFETTGAVRVADYPVSLAEGSVAPSSLAVSKGGRVCVGLVWSTNALCLVDGAWRPALEVTGDIGGSSVAGLTFNDAGTLMAVGVGSVAVAGRKSVQLGPFAPSPFSRKHLLGAIATSPHVEGANVVASGGWGGTVFLDVSEGGASVVGRGGPDDRKQPYIIRQFAVHPQLGLLAAGDEGLYRWDGTLADGSWRSLRDIDPRLAAPIVGVVSSSGRSVWVASGARASLIRLPAAKPEAVIIRSPSIEPIQANALTYQLSTPGLVGLPASKTIAIDYDPPIANAQRRLLGPDARLDLSDLDDLAAYRVTATVSDGFLNTGPSTVSTFSVRLPFYKNPYKITFGIVLLFAIAGLLLTRRGPTAFLLQRIGGLRWSTEKSDPRFAIEVSDLGADEIRYELEAPSAMTLVRVKVDVPSVQLAGAPKDALPYLVDLAEGRVRARGEDFGSVIDRIGRALGEEVLPPSIRFATSQVEGGAISIDVAKSLLWLPLELADDGGGSRMMLRYAIGRTVSADRLADAEPPRSQQLRVAVFAPRVDPVVPVLPDAEAEARSVAAAARSWGASVTIVRPDATKAEVLDALCDAHMFHYAGHAEFEPDDAGRSFLPILCGRIYADDVATALRASPHNLLFAFINGCGTSREAAWDRADSIYGFASAFLKNGSYFIGAQWPIEDRHAADFAVAFYSELFPPSYNIWWRLIRRDPLRGLPFAEALRLARHALYEDDPTAAQTANAYVFYGDPTRRLVLT